MQASYLLPTLRSRSIATVVVAVGIVVATSIAAAERFDSGAAPFPLRFGDRLVSYRTLAFSVMPGSSTEIEVMAKGASDEFTASVDAGELVRWGTGRWQWTAPSAAGLGHVVVSESSTEESVLLNVFVEVPADRVEDRSLNGYRIGAYPEAPFRGLDRYLPPRGFVEVTPENEQTRLSPHFTLDQFVCKQESGYPKYVVLSPELWLKLEYLLEAFDRAGHHAPTFAVLSGFRTPFYNAAIGNVRHSRHQWGDAADIFVDTTPADGVMDDLDGDGEIDSRDADVMADLVERLVDEPGYEGFVGGLGRYGNAAIHGPFIHVDVRGYRARWAGDSYDG